MHSIYNIACSVFKMRPPARLREREKQRAQELQAVIEKLTLKVQRQVHKLKEKFRYKRTRYFEKKDAEKLLMSQIKGLENTLDRKDDKIAEQEDLLALVLSQACARE